MINYRNSRSDYAFDFIIYFIMIFMLLIITYPLYFVVIASISDPNLVNAGKVLFIAKGISFKGYELIYKNKQIWNGYLNTVNYAACYSILSVSMSLLTGYALSRKDLVGRKFFNLFFVLTMYFSGGLIPYYLLIKQLNLIDKFYTMWLIGVLVVFHVILARTFFETSIPDELSEAASIDGCNQAQFFAKIVLPLSKPIIAVLALYSIVGQWNSYFNAMIYLNQSKHFPLQLVLREILVQSQSLQNTMTTIGDLQTQEEQAKIADLVKYGVIIVSAAPLLIIYPFLQKYFVQGVMIGSVKG